MRWLPLLLLLGCTVEVAEPTSCEEAPTVTWDTFGAGYLSTYCQGCHASTAIDRQGAPEVVVFDTEADALAWGDAILAATSGDLPRMPPSGGPTLDDADRLAVWLQCNPP